MADKLKTIKRSSSTTTTTSVENKKIPTKEEIRTQTVRTETEEIENGFLVTKYYDGTYWTGKDKKDYNWFNYTKKWFTKEDPLTITLNDKALADAFEE